jgi:hypothetical protein
VATDTNLTKRTQLQISPETSEALDFDRNTAMSESFKASRKTAISATSAIFDCQFLNDSNKLNNPQKRIDRDSMGSTDSYLQAPMGKNSDDLFVDAYEQQVCTPPLPKRNPRRCSWTLDKSDDKEQHTDCLTSASSSVKSVYFSPESQFSGSIKSKNDATQSNSPPSRTDAGCEPHPGTQISFKLAPNSFNSRSSSKLSRHLGGIPDFDFKWNSNDQSSNVNDGHNHISITPSCLHRSSLNTHTIPREYDSVPEEEHGCRPYSGEFWRTQTSDPTLCECQASHALSSNLLLGARSANSPPPMFSSSSQASPIITPTPMPRAALRRRRTAPARARKRVQWQNSPSMETSGEMTEAIDMEPEMEKEIQMRIKGIRNGFRMGVGNSHDDLK